MIHQGQCLALGLETGDHLLGIHPRLDDLQCHLAAHRPLCSAMYTTPMPPSPITSVSAVTAGKCSQQLAAFDHVDRGDQRYRWHFEELADIGVRRQQGVDTMTKVCIPTADFVQITVAGAPGLAAAERQKKSRRFPGIGC